MLLDMVLTHEIVHGIMFANLTATQLNRGDLPLWYAEGLAEATVGNNRFLDFTDDYYSYYYQSWELAQQVARDFSDQNQDDVYYFGYLFVNWLDNYGKNTGSGTVENGGQMAVLNEYLSNPPAGTENPTFEAGIMNVFGKFSTILIEEFKAEIAQPQTYREFTEFASEKMNIQCNDGKADALKNTDAPETDIVPNDGFPRAISETNTLEYESTSSNWWDRNRRVITIVWIFSLVPNPYD
jgi:hypothetical protein